MKSKSLIFMLLIFFLILVNVLIYPVGELLRHNPFYSDLAVHFQTFLNFKKVSLFTMNFWNPANGFGEVSLLNYFPVPFFIMKLASFLMPAAVAFNFAIFIPIILLPLIIYKDLRQTNFSILQSFTVMLLALCVLYTPESDNWGGTANGVFRGQFAHLYALVFLFLFKIKLQNYISGKSGIFWPAICAGLVIGSHVLVGFWLFVVSIQVFLEEKQNHRIAILKLFKVSGLALLLSAFYVAPFLDNLPWVFYVQSKSYFLSRWREEYFPNHFLLLFVIAAITSMYLIARGRTIFFLETWRRIKFKFLSFMLSVFLLYVFEWMNLTSGRAFHQIQYFFIICIGSYFVILFDQCKPLITRTVLYFLLCAFAFVNIYQSKDALRINFNLQYDRSIDDEKIKLSFDELTQIKGSYNESRIEGSFLPGSGDTAYLVDWIMLPTYINRMVASSLYIESNHTNAYWLYFKCLIGFCLCYSESMTCPKRGDYKGLLSYMNFLGIQDIISIKPKSDLSSAVAPGFTQKTLGKFFEIQSAQEKIKLVDVIKSEDITLQKFSFNYLELFHKRFREDVKNGKYLLLTTSDVGQVSDTLDMSMSTAQCDPSLEVDLNIIKLKTNCPGRWHRIKFSYNPALVSDVPLHLISPGFIAILPQKNTNIFFKRKFIWRVADFISIGTLLFFIMIYIKNLAFWRSRNLPVFLFK